MLLLQHSAHRVSPRIQAGVGHELGLERGSSLEFEGLSPSGMPEEGTELKSFSREKSAIAMAATVMWPLA